MSILLPERDDVRRVLHEAEAEPPALQGLTETRLRTPMITGVDRWALWLLVALVRYRERQEWVARVVTERLGGDLEAIEHMGAFGHPQHRDQEGLVPGMPEWEYFFHGCGCCLTSRIDGTVIDVDFVDGRCDVVDPFFFGNFLDSLEKPALPERLVAHAPPLEDAWCVDVPTLRRLGLLVEGERIEVASLGLELCERIEPIVQRLCDGADDSDSGSVGGAVYLAVSVGDYVLASMLAGRGSHPVTGLVSAHANSQIGERMTTLRERRREGAGEVTGGSFLAATAALGRGAVEQDVRVLLTETPADRAVPLALEIVAAWDDPSLNPLLLDLIEREPSDGGPVPAWRVRACEILLRHIPTDERDAAVPGTGARPEIRQTTEPELGRAPAERIRRCLVGVLTTSDERCRSRSVFPDRCHPPAAFLLYLLDESDGIRWLGNTLRSDVPNDRVEAAAALATIGTEGAKRALLERLRDTRFEETHEARAALLELSDPTAWEAVRDWESERGPLPVPEAETIEIDGCARDVFSFEDPAIREDYVRGEIRDWRERYSDLLHRWKPQGHPRG